MDDIVDSGAVEKATDIAKEARDKGVLNLEIQDSGRNAVFSALVKGDSDITGLVAYSIFKQNELDWLGEFRTAKGREPTEDEADAYIIGESTPRRLATYRHLADATLAGNGPDVAAGGVSPGRAVALRQDVRSGGGFGGATVAYIVIALVVLVAVYFAARYGGAK
jgi:hypothetical protein